MEEIGRQFNALWSKPIPKELENDDNQKFIYINKTRIHRESATEMEEYLMKEFINYNKNIYDLHFSLVDFCFNQTDMKNRSVGIIFLNNTFENWYKQQKNRIVRRTTKNGNHISKNCSDTLCLCSQSDELLLRAFTLAIYKVFYLLSSFNKLYNFSQNVELIRPFVNDFLNASNDMDKFKLISELNLCSFYETVKINYEDVNGEKIYN